MKPYYGAGPASSGGGYAGSVKAASSVCEWLHQQRWA